MDIKNNNRGATVLKNPFFKTDEEKYLSKLLSESEKIGKDSIIEEKNIEKENNKIKKDIQNANDKINILMKNKNDKNIQEVININNIVKESIKNISIFFDRLNKYQKELISRYNQAKSTIKNNESDEVIELDENNIINEKIPESNDKIKKIFLILKKNNILIDNTNKLIDEIDSNEKTLNISLKKIIGSFEDKKIEKDIKIIDNEVERNYYQNIKNEIRKLRNYNLEGNIYIKELDESQIKNEENKENEENEENNKKKDEKNKNIINKLTKININLKESVKIIDANVVKINESKQSLEKIKEDVENNKSLTETEIIDNNKLINLIDLSIEKIKKILDDINNDNEEIKKERNSTEDLIVKIEGKILLNPKINGFFNLVMNFISKYKYIIVLCIIFVLLYILLLYHIVIFLNNLYLSNFSYTKLNTYKNKYNLKDFFPFFDSYVSVYLVYVFILYFLSLIVIIIIYFKNKYYFDNNKNIAFILGIYCIIAFINIVYIIIYTYITNNSNKKVYEINKELNKDIYENICPLFLNFISKPENKGKQLKELLLLYIKIKKECINKNSENNEIIIENRKKLLITYSFEKYYINFKNTIVSSASNLLTYNKNIFEYLDINKSNILIPLTEDDDNLNDILNPFNKNSEYNIKSNVESDAETDNKYDKIKLAIKDEYNALQSKTNNNIKLIKYYSDSIFVKLFTIFTIISMIMFTLLLIIFFYIFVGKKEYEVLSKISEIFKKFKNYILIFIAALIFSLLIS